MLNRFPSEVDDFATLLADPGLRHLTPAALAKFLGVSVRTVRRWKKGKAPRHVLLVLWAFSWSGLLERIREADNLASMTASIQPVEPRFRARSRWTRTPASRPQARKPRRGIAALPRGLDQRPTRPTA